MKNNSKLDWVEEARSNLKQETRSKKQFGRNDKHKEDKDKTMTGSLDEIPLGQNQNKDTNCVAVPLRCYEVVWQKSCAESLCFAFPKPFLVKKRTLLRTRFQCRLNHICEFKKRNKYICIYIKLCYIFLFVCLF